MNELTEPQLCYSGSTTCEDPCRTPVDERTTPRQIVIDSFNYGYSVTVGCQRFAIESLSKLLINLEAYLTNPAETEREWMKEKKLK